MYGNLAMQPSKDSVRLVVPRHCLHSHVYNLNWDVGNLGMAGHLTPKILVSNCGLLLMDGSGFLTAWQSGRTSHMAAGFPLREHTMKEDEKAAISLKG